ncbi:hypothetical protein [Plantactinospora sp. BC1]|uniref:hypothetical protein n=1 Tax=Plantactinospora sp. BC1 TaxID=2108470 RepID=UPI00131F3E9D|nr:hypothetical protein [Plantactinospora sp. BC1]
MSRTIQGFGVGLFGTVCLFMQTGREEASIQVWLDEVWSRARRVVVLQGGEGEPPTGERQTLAVIEDGASLNRIREWTTAGEFVADICRCPGDLTLVLYDSESSAIGSASLHPDRVAWERSIFLSDLCGADLVALRLFLSGLGINGASGAVLDKLISVLNLHEGDVQFRRAGDRAELVARRVPLSLVDVLSLKSGEQAANLEQDLVERLTADLVRAEGSWHAAIKRLFAWLGSVTWPAEAVAGDGQLVRRMLDEFDAIAIARVLPELAGPPEVMGAVAWAAFRGEDASTMSVLGSAIIRLLRQS